MAKQLVHDADTGLLKLVKIQEYRPDQARGPKGDPTGGEFVDEGGDPTRNSRAGRESAAGDLKKYSPDQEREPSGSPEGGRFAEMGAGDGQVARGMTRASAKTFAEVYERNSRDDRSAGAAEMRGRGQALREHASRGLTQEEAEARVAYYRNAPVARPRDVGPFGTGRRREDPDFVVDHDGYALDRNVARGRLAAYRQIAGDLKKYSPDQEREPSGSAEGGQFAEMGRGGPNAATSAAIEDALRSGDWQYAQDLGWDPDGEPPRGRAPLPTGITLGPRSKGRGWEKQTVRLDGKRIGRIETQHVQHGRSPAEERALIDGIASMGNRDARLSALSSLASRSTSQSWQRSRVVAYGQGKSAPYKSFAFDDMRGSFAAVTDAIAWLKGKAGA